MTILFPFQNMTGGSRSTARRGCLFAGAAAVALVIGSVAARADCQEDVAKIMQRREAAVAFVNKAKANNGKLDPTLACPRLRSLSAIENEAVAYFSKNGAWCNLPPDLTEKMTASAKRTVVFAGQACTFAAKVKQMQTQQAQQQQEAAPKLPSGPL